ncbi:MAG: hypothetical protein ACYC6O_00140 [Thermoleophilia bacterium]
MNDKADMKETLLVKLVLLLFIGFLVSILWQGISWALVYIGYQDLVLSVAMLEAALISTPALSLAFVLWTVIIVLSNDAGTNNLIKNKTFVIFFSISLGLIFNILVNAWLVWEFASYFADHPKYQNFFTGLPMKGWISLILMSLSGAVEGLIIGIGNSRIFHMQ